MHGKWGATQSSKSWCGLCSNVHGNQQHICKPKERCGRPKHPCMRSNCACLTRTSDHKRRKLVLKQREKDELAAAKKSLNENGAKAVVEYRQGSEHQRLLDSPFRTTTTPENRTVRRGFTVDSESVSPKAASFGTVDPPRHVPPTYLEQAFNVVSADVICECQCFSPGMCFYTCGYSVCTSALLVFLFLLYMHSFGTGGSCSWLHVVHNRRWDEMKEGGVGMLSITPQCFHGCISVAVSLLTVKHYEIWPPQRCFWKLIFFFIGVSLLATQANTKTFCPFSGSLPARDVKFVPPRKGLVPLVCAPLMVEASFLKNTFLTHIQPIFCPKRADFQIILGF